MTTSLKSTRTVQPLICVVPVLVTPIFIWKEVPLLLATVAVQLCAANTLPNGNMSIAAAIIKTDNMDNLEPNTRT